MSLFTVLDVLAIGAVVFGVMIHFNRPRPQQARDAWNADYERPSDAAKHLGD